MVGDPQLERLIRDGMAVDPNGRIAFGNSELSDRLRAALPVKKKSPKPPANGNCSGCNTSSTCSGDPNLICKPTNLVPECGSKIKLSTP